MESLSSEHRLFYVKSWSYNQNLLTSPLLKQSLLGEQDPIIGLYKPPLIWRKELTFPESCKEKVNSCTKLGSF